MTIIDVISYRFELGAIVLMDKRVVYGPIIIAGPAIPVVYACTVVAILSFVLGSRVVSTLDTTMTNTDVCQIRIDYPNRKSLSNSYDSLQ